MDFVDPSLGRHFICILSTRTLSHAGPFDESEAGGKHGALNVGEVHRVEDRRGGTRRAARSTTGRRGRVSTTEIKAGESE